MKIIAFKIEIYHNLKKKNKKIKINHDSIIYIC
jgi:hypothetical protein